MRQWPTEWDSCFINYTHSLNRPRQKLKPELKTHKPLNND